MKVFITTPRGLVDLQNRLDDFSPILEKVRTLFAESAGLAFRSQSFDGQAWPARYQFQGSPFINVAGAISDLSKGTSVKANRFERRPAGVDTGSLRNAAVNPAVILGPNGTIEVKVIHPRASLINEGGISSQTITDITRQNLAVWLAQNKEYRSKLRFAFKRDVLDTQVMARPFLSSSPAIEEDLAKIIEEYLTQQVDNGNQQSS